MGILGDIAGAVTSLPKTVSSAVTGRKGVLGGRGVLGNVFRGNFAGAVKAAGGAVSKVGSNHLLQAAMGNIAVPAAIIGAAAQHGPNGALSAVKSAANNPIMKAELAAAGVIFPPVAPISAAGIAGMEGVSRIVDGIRSKNPAMVAQAAVQIAGTQLLAKAGNPGAIRALRVMKTVDTARKVVNGAVPGGVNGARRAVSNVMNAARGGNKNAKALLTVIQHQTLREAHKVIAKPTSHPLAKAKARKVITKAQIKAPGLLAPTVAAIKAPKGVRAGDFAVLQTGRILYRGKPVRKVG